MNTAALVLAVVMGAMVVAGYIVVGLTARWAREATSGTACSKCKYPLAVPMGGDDRCPECGTYRCYMVFEPGAWVSWWQRLSASVIAPCATAMVAALMCAWLRPGDDAAVVAMFAAAPHGVVLLAVLLWHNTSEAKGTLEIVTPITVLCNLLLALVMHNYWTNKPDSEDFMWPITDIFLLSVLYFVVFACVFVGIALSKAVTRARGGRRDRNGRA